MLLKEMWLFILRILQNTNMLRGLKSRIPGNKSGDIDSNHISSSGLTYLNSKPILIILYQVTHNTDTDVIERLL
jgi:hypothetical protein